MTRLDPTLDVVFKRLLTRRPELLVDMLEAILGRTIRSLEIIETEAWGEGIRDKRVVFDIRVILDDGTRVVIEMQRRGQPALEARLTFYVARNHSDQLGAGDDYGQLAPTVVIAWVVDPILESDRLHSIFELRERHDHCVLDDRIAIHVLQLSGTLAPTSTPQEAQVQRWARFFRAHSDVELDELALEDPIMAMAVQTLDQISQDPQIIDAARKRAYDIWFYEWSLRRSREKGFEDGLEKGFEDGREKGFEDGREKGFEDGREEGFKNGKVELVLKLLEHRFGPISEDIEGRVRQAGAERLDAWAGKVLTAATVEEVLAARAMPG